MAEYDNATALVGAATKARPGAWRDGATACTVAHSGSPLGVMFFQLFPASRDTCTSPSSVPAQSSPGTVGDSSKVRMFA